MGGTGGTVGTRGGAGVGRDGRVGDRCGVRGGIVCRAPVDCRDGRNGEMFCEMF